MSSIMLYSSVLPGLILVISIIRALWYGKDEVKPELIVGVSVSVILFFITCAVLSISVNSKTTDTEIFNGQVTSKERNEDSYLESYDCHCRMVTKGSGKNASTVKECDTCWRRRYTVEWIVKTTLGDYDIDDVNSLSPSIYATPNPTLYNAAYVGEPVAKTHSYVNYIIASDNSIFKSNNVFGNKYASLIPKYPIEIYDQYKINRFLTMGVTVPAAKEWNNGIGLMLRELGPSKQANLIIVVANTNDTNYPLALQAAWNGGKKNDVIVVIGSTHWPKIDFVHVLSWSTNNLLAVEIRDKLLAMNEAECSASLKIIHDSIKNNFVRRRMVDFEYLKDEILPDSTIVIAMLIIQILATLCVTFRGTVCKLINRLNY